jgi:hypothetical protein
MEQGESRHGERPDALGWDGTGFSTLIECKASRADFLADRRKVFRDVGCWHLGMGQRRFYMTPPKLLLPADVPERWGLLECHQHRVVIVKDIPIEAAYETFDGNVARNEFRLIFNQVSPSLPTPCVSGYADLIRQINEMLRGAEPWLAT